METIKDIFSEIRKGYEQGYGFAVFDLACEEIEGEIVLRGQVLTENQKAKAIEKAKEFYGREVKDEITVLSDAETTPIGWARVKAERIDLHSRFVPSAVMNEHIAKRILASQAAEGEVLRVLLKKDDQILVQGGDLVLGWADLAGLEIGDESLSDEWRQGAIAEPEQAIIVDESADVLIKEVEKFLGVPYVLGARSEKGIDCSAFVQLVFKRAYDIVLPRHSWDQKKMGAIVDLSEAQTGDLVFMINKNTDTKHVGIWEKTIDEKNIIHASFAEGKVVRQRSEEVFEKYELVEIRRIIKR